CREIPDRRRHAARGAAPRADGRREPDGRRAPAAGVAGRAAGPAGARRAGTDHGAPDRREQCRGGRPRARGRRRSGVHRIAGAARRSRPRGGGCGRARAGGRARTSVGRGRVGHEVGRRVSTTGRARGGQRHEKDLGGRRARQAPPGTGCPDRRAADLGSRALGRGERAGAGAAVAAGGRRRRAPGPSGRGGDRQRPGHAPHHGAVARWHPGSGPHPSRSRRGRDGALSSSPRPCPRPMSEAAVTVGGMTESDALAGLDAAQRQAVEHGDGLLVIAAGAGTGKTRVLTSRVARLLEAGVAPERILLLTFTRRAAAAMASRAAALCGDPQAAQRIAGGTFHAVAHRLVAEHAQHLGLADVTLLDPDDVIDLLDLLRSEHGLDGTTARLPTTRTIADIGSRAINTGTPARTVVDEQFPWALEHADAVIALLRHYSARKRERGLLDLDDLLIAWRA